MNIEYALQLCVPDVVVARPLNFILLHAQYKYSFEIRLGRMQMTGNDWECTVGMGMRLDWNGNQVGLE